jgi:hypothetical protein
MAILALMLLTSHVALISHVTAHFEPELEQCELCVSQGQLFNAIPMHEQGIFPDSGLGLSYFHAPRSAVTVQHFRKAQQRAPPAPSP